jgi:hypothetical protein
MNIIDISNDPSPVKVQPWDYEVNIPVLNKTYEMADFYDTFPAFNGSYSQDLALPLWPADTNQNFGGSTLINIGAIKIDFDSNGTDDAVVEKLRSTNASITLKFTLYDSSKTVEHPITLSNISNPVLTVDGVLYNFSNAYVSGNSVIFTTQYLTSATDWCVNPAGFNAGPVNVDLKDQPASYVAGDIMTGTADFDFGDQAEAVVSISSDITMLDTTIPLNDIPFISTFILDLKFDNSLANKFEIIMDGVTYPISTGSISYSDNGGHYFASSYVTTDESIAMVKNGTNPSIKIKIKQSEDFLTKGNNFIRLSRNGQISAKLILSGKTY